MKTTVIRRPHIPFLMALTAISALILNPMIAHSIGQVTTPIERENIMKGAEFTQQIIPFNSANRELIFDLRTDGDIEGWATFYEASDTNLDNPVGHIRVLPASYGRATALFRIPEGTPHGIYKGNVVIASRELRKYEEGEEEEGMTTSVLQISSRAVTITVTDEKVVGLEGKALPNDFGISSGDTLDLRFIYGNFGNINIKPDARVRIMEYDSETVVHETIYPYPDNEKPIRPRERRELTYVSWPTAGQSTGRYRVNVDFMVNGEVYDSDDFRFSIHSKRFGYWETSLALLSSDNLRTGSIFALAFLLLGGAVVGAKRTVTNRYAFKGVQSEQQAMQQKPSE